MRARNFALAVLATAAACNRPADAGDAKAATASPSNLTLTPAQQSRIHVVTASPTSFQPTIETTGTVAFNGDRSTQVLSPVSGPVTRLIVQPGAYVSKGAPLATVSSPDFASAIAAYRKAAQNATNLQRIAAQNEQLFKTDAISRREVEQAQTDAAGAIADREAAVEQLRALGIDPAGLSGSGNAAAVIRAPISGTLVERLITPGQLLQAGATPAFTIADLSSVWVMANVFESDLASVRKGESVAVSSDVSPTPFTGVVDYVAALVDSSTRATSVRVVVNNRGDLLKRDMYVRVAIRGETPRTAILVPEAAVLRDDENLPFVFVASGSGYARRRIVVGSHVGGSYEVRSGLNAGDRVVAEGSLFLQFAESQ